MKHLSWIAGPAALLMTVGAAGLVQASPTSPATGLTGIRLAAKGAGKKGNKGNKGNNPANRDIRQLELVLGTPLTAEQRQGVMDAYKTYHEGVARAVGLTVADLDAKTKEYRKAHPGQGRRGGAGANAPVAPPTTTPPANVSPA